MGSASNDNDTVQAHWEQLASYGFCIRPNYVSSKLIDELRSDVLTLRSERQFAVSQIGSAHDGLQEDMTTQTPVRDIRYSETCFIGRQRCRTEPEFGKSNARFQLYDVIDGLRHELTTNPILQTGERTRDAGSLDPNLEEVLYAYYPHGGYYRRHVDAEADSISTIRRYSFLLYLNTHWTDADGGCLRIHLDGGQDELPVGELPNFIDVEPKAGTLVVFCSDRVPHEVLDTRTERMTVVGWFLAEQDLAVPPGTSITNSNDGDAFDGSDLESEMAAIRAELEQAEAAAQEAAMEAQRKADRLKRLRDRLNAAKQNS